MKLASLKGGRDGRLAVVSHDLSRYVVADEVAGTLQEALDNWARCEPKLRAIAERLHEKKSGDARTRT
jgi:fumarylacetoacetate (FAA) hydrolase